MLWASAWKRTNKFKSYPNSLSIRIFVVFATTIPSVFNFSLFFIFIFLACTTFGLQNFHSRIFRRQTVNAMAIRTSAKRLCFTLTPTISSLGMIWLIYLGFATLPGPTCRQCLQLKVQSCQLDSHDAPIHGLPMSFFSKLLHCMGIN